MYNKFLLIASLSLASGAFTIVRAQSQKRIIQLSGVILEQDSVRAIPGAHIYVPKAGRGTPSNTAGFFSMPVLIGDSVVISAIGFKRQHYIVPDHYSDFLTIIVEMVEDVTTLPQEVIVRTFPTEEVFKQAVLALNVPLNENEIDKKALNAELLALMTRSAPMDASLNYKYYMDQTIAGYNSKFQPVMNPFLNPFNWARFFKDLKKNKKK